jgi:hypothetical protein
MRVPLAWLTAQDARVERRREEFAA